MSAEQIKKSQMQVLAYAAGTTVWLFRSSVPPADTIDAAFWEPARDVLRVGDVILQIYDRLADGSVPFATIRYVESLHADGVKVADLFCEHAMAQHIIKQEFGRE